MTFRFYQRFVLYGIVCSKKVFLIAFNTQMLILLTNLEMLISASFLPKHESFDKSVSEKYFNNPANVSAVFCSWIALCKHKLKPCTMLGVSTTQLSTAKETNGIR